MFYYFPRASAATWSTYAITKRLASKHTLYLIYPYINYRTSLKTEDATLSQKNNSAILHRVSTIGLPEALAPILAPILMFFEGMKLVKSCDIIVCQFQPHHFVYITGVILAKIFNKPIVARANDIFHEMGENKSFS